MVSGAEVGGIQPKTAPTGRKLTKSKAVFIIPTRTPSTKPSMKSLAIFEANSAIIEKIHVNGPSPVISTEMCLKKKFN